jgi:phosphotransferase system HPr-like phosphotransfer protein
MISRSQRLNVAIAASLVLNALIAYRLFDRSRESESEAAPKSSARRESTTRAHPEAAEVSPSLDSTRVPFWRTLDSSAPVAFYNDLKAAGFPNALAREIADTMIFAQLQDIAEKYAGSAPKAYWRPLERELLNEEVRKRRAEEEQAYFEALRTIMYDPVPIDGSAEALENARLKYGELPVSTIKRLAEIEAEFSRRRLTLQQSLGPNVSRDEHTASLVDLQREQQAALEKLLTPEELNEYRLRNGEVASFLRYHMPRFRPSEAEYKALHALHEEERERIKARYPNRLNFEPTPEEQAAFEEKVRAALGPERFADYLEVTKHEKDNTALVVARLGLPARRAGEIRQLRKDFTARAQSIQNDPHLDAAQKAARLTSLAAEARNSISHTLGGTRGLQAYESIRGDWLRALESGKTP